MKKILIIQTAFIGDVILATSIVETLYQAFPDAQISFLLRKGNEELLAGHPFIYELLVWDKKQNKYSNLFHIISKIRHTRYNYVVNLQRFAATGIVTLLSKATVTIGFDKNPLSFFFTKKIKHRIGNSETNVHEIDRNYDLISSLTSLKRANVKLYPSQNDFLFVEKYKKEKYTCIAPASVWFTKQFPKDKWAELINASNNNTICYLLGSSNDAELCDNIAKLCPTKKVINLSGKLSLLQTAALMRDAAMNYVNDSAPIHLASAVDANTTAVFCSTIPAFGFGPLAEHSKVVETKELLSCRPCGLHGLKACPEGHFKCAYNIKIEQLIS